MLEKIKSSYFVKNLFTNLEERKKLEIVKYNKSLQDNLDIYLFNYKEFTKKYIKYETKTKGKEYNSYNDKLLFEGEYLNEKKNGKGKEYYYNGELIFEGEYKNGNRNGKGREYNINGKLKFEGEFLNGERNGKGKEYNFFGKLYFEGEYLNGEINGKGKEYYDNGKLKFE